MGNKLMSFDPEKPFAHYEQCRRLYIRVKRWLEAGIAVPIISFLCGVSCILYNPWLMAVFALFAIPFTLLSIIGCKTRRPKMCFVAVPLAVAAAVTCAVSGALTASLGAVVYCISALVAANAVRAAFYFYKLKELPGFPFFDPSMDGLSFAALDRQDAEEFVEGESESEKTVYRFDPNELEPSDKMEEIITGVSLKKEDHTVEERDGTELAPLDEESAYERMMKIKNNDKSDISDIELFG